jgi:PadR family transcriptional regulator, regulatory protein PadR
MQNKDFPSLSHKEFIILEMLVNGKEMFGLEMVESSGGELKRGTIYVTLQRMSEKGYVESREEARIEPEIGIPRRKYQASRLGEKIFKAQELALRYLEMNMGWN